MTISKIITSLFIFIPFICFLQSSQLIGSSVNNEYSSSICADNQGNIYFGATIDDQSWVFKKDVEGNTIWSKLLDFSTTYNSTISTIQIIGDTIFGCGSVKNGVQIKGGTIFKLNANNGVPYWLKSEETSSSYFSSMKYANGKYFLAGSQVNGSNGYSAKVWAISSNSGNTIWQTGALGITFPGFNNDYIDDITAATEMINGKMFLTGRSYVNGATGGLNMRPLLIGIDEYGTIFLKKYLLINTNNSQTSRLYGGSIYYDGPDSLIIGFYGDDNCNSGCTDFKSGIIKMDLNGIISWSKYYDVQGEINELEKGINVTENGYMMYGITNHGLTNFKIFTLKTDKSGNVQTCKIISQSNTSFTTNTPINAGGVSAYKNNKHYIAGSYYASDPNNRDIVQIILDTNLNDPITCLQITPTLVTAINYGTFIGDINIVNNANTVTNQNVFVNSDLPLPNSCPSIDVDFQSTVTCNNSTITASVIGITNPQYSWSNGTFGETISTSTIDTFVVTITNSLDCCVIYDTIISSITNSTSIIVSLPNDTSICLNTTSNFNLLSEIQNQTTGLSYLWSTGETTSQIAINTPGLYWIEVTDDCSTSRDTILITPGGKKELVLDFLIQSPTCSKNAELECTSIIGGTSPYLFKVDNLSQQSSPNFYNLQTGNHLFQVQDYDGCVFDTMFTISGVQNINDIRIPNCFTPNQIDDFNSNWFVTGNCIEEYTCSIFNRWGNLIITMNEINDDWDGKINGLDASEGVYFYKIQYKYYDGNLENISGPITLIR